MSTTPKLRRFLRRAFSPDELRRMIAELPGGDELRAQLPGAGASLDALIDAAVEALERRGSLDGTFFLRLVAARPHLAPTIREIAEGLAVAVPDAVEVATLLSERQDAAAASKLTELERACPTTSEDRIELNLAVADLSRWQREKDVNAAERAQRRHAIAYRLTTLAASMSSRAPLEADDDGRAPHPEALELRDEIEGHVRDADGGRAVLRLLDLVERFDVASTVRRRTIMLSARVQTWRSAQKHGASLGPGERQEWIDLLQSILDLADRIVQSTSVAPPDASGERPGLGRFAALASSTDYLAPLGPLLRCSSLSKRYSKHGPCALRGISFALLPRTILGVVGPNGSGKTTLLEILAGELRHEGSLAYPQLQAREDAIDWLAIRSRIAYVPQRLPAWNGRLIDNLHSWATAYGIRGRDNADIVEFYLERLGLTHCCQARWGEVSRGYRKRFALARALVGRPRLLLLDEPLAGLDLHAQQAFLRDLHDIVLSSSQRQAAVISSQHIPEVEAIADQMLGLRADGSVWFHGGVRDLEAACSGSLFEIGGRLEDATRDRLTTRFGPGCLHQRESVTLIRVDRGVPRQAVLDLLCEGGTPPIYFRDISGSHVRMFWGDK